MFLACSKYSPEQKVMTIGANHKLSVMEVSRLHLNNADVRNCEKNYPSKSRKLNSQRQSLSLINFDQNFIFVTKREFKRYSIQMVSAYVQTYVLWIFAELKSLWKLLFSPIKGRTHQGNAEIN